MSYRIVVVVLGVLSCSAIAQNPPKPDRDPFENAPPFNNGPDKRPGPGGGNPLLVQVDMMRNWLDLIDRYARMARDPVTSGVAAVVGATDVLRSRPPEQAIDYFTKLLTEVKNESVQRAIRIQLVELYGKANQPDHALEQLRLLMIAAPAQDRGAPAGPPPK